MASDEKLAEQMAFESHEEGMGFAVEPLSTCPHLDQVNALPKPIDVSEKCSKCGDGKENWICLTCFEVNCGRFVNGDGVSHHKSSNHPVALSFSDLSVWCYLCEAYIHNPRLTEAKESAHKNKFPEN